MIKIQAAKVIISRDIRKCLAYFIKTSPCRGGFLTIPYAKPHSVVKEKKVVTDNNIAYFLATFVIFDYLCVQEREKM